VCSFVGGSGGLHFSDIGVSVRIRHNLRSARSPRCRARAKSHGGRAHPAARSSSPAERTIDDPVQRVAVRFPAAGPGAGPPRDQ
jgi:hypothetical protein